MEFQILGPVRAVHAGSELRLGGRRHRRLLAALLVHAGEVVSIERLTDALWGASPPRSARAMVHVRVSELRAALRPGGRDLLARHDGGYLLRMGPDSLDARRFERLAAAGARALAAGDTARSRADLAAALALWRGAVLDEFAEEPFARPEIARLKELRLKALEDRMAADLHLGTPAELVAQLRALVAEYPLRERFWAQLMLALYRSGRQAEALQVYQDVRRFLADRLGVDPGAELRRLHSAVLRHELWLDLPVARVHAPAPSIKEQHAWFDLRSGVLSP